MFPACFFLHHKRKRSVAYSNPLFDGLHVAKAERYDTVR